ncbi:hypothetical protein HZC30_04100, partial [Candidatus Woesearchaeota archaeon]|nr:hypothetical protein [Candidatus Woesearchaeota archaeon]
CNGTAWKEEKCDSKGKHLYNASNTKQTLYMCYDNIWQPVNYTSETKTLSPSDDFEVIITKDIMLSDLNGVKDLTLCDNGTESTNNKATYCYASYSDKSVNKKKSAKTGKAMDAGVQLDNIIYPTPQGPDVQTKLLIPLENLPTFDFGKTLPQYAFLSNLANLSGSITLTFQKVFSLEHLKGPGTPPLLATIKGQQVAFLYEKETSVSKDKKVSIIMVSDVTASKGQTFKSDVFTTNLNNGQRVVLKKDSYYYLLGLKSPGAGFDIENLYLKRLPSLEEYPMEVKVPDNTVYFKAKGNDFTVSFSGVGFIEITPTEAKTQPVGTGEPYSLLKEYEVPITKNQPIELTAPKIPNVKKIYFCDEVSSSEKANICFDKESNKHEIYSLNYLYGASSTIYANSGVAFLYETVTSSSEAKQVKAILIQDITSKEAVLESDTFAENMKNGRRLVLKLGNLYYLLSHPNVGAGDYSPKLLTLHYLPSLINYSNSGYVTLASKGVQGVQFAPYGGTTITIYPEGNYYKISSKLSKEVATTGGFPEDISYTYEVSFDKEKPVTLLNINGQEPTIKVCSDDLKSDKTKMQVCISGAGAPVKVTLFHDTPLMINVSNTSLVFLYQTVLYQADNTTINKKQGHIFLVKDLSQTPSEQDYNNLIINLAEGGRRFALNFGGKFYLLSHTFPSPTGFFEMTELKLTLYQDGNEIEIPAVGTEKKVSFSLPDGGRITLNGGEMEQFVIPGPYKILTYANLPTLGLPIDLKDNLHAVFSSIKPVTITLPEMGLVQASELDPKEDKSTFKVKLNLENMDLSSDLLGENKLPSDFTLSYQKPLIMTKGEDKVLLYYNKFNYVDKQPIKYVDIYYMQPKDEFIETAADALKGEIEEVVIPTPPFQIWAQTKQQIADIPINLKETLYTTFSSEGPVNVVQPKLGLVQVSETVDQKKVQALFKIQFTGTSQKYQLPYQKPFVAKEVPNLLFYYDQAYFVGAVPVKSAKIYYLYDITKDPFYHDFNNQFVETLTAGNELALKFKDSYYLLGYKGASQENTTFFEENKLQLKALNNSALYENPESTDEGLLFKVPEGNIFVKIDYANNKIIFSTKTTEALSLEEFSEEKYTHILTTANKVVINQTTVSMCSLKLYADIPSSAGICFNSSNNATPVTDYKTFIIEGKPYLLEVGDQTGAEKEVVIHQVLPLNITPWTVNWEQFSQKLIDGDTPVFDIGGTLYLPSTPDNQLKSLFFKEVGDANAEWSYAENLQEIGKTAILFNGTFVLKDRLLFADQTMKGEERDLTLTLRDYYIVPYTGVMELNKTNYINVPFVTKIDGKKYSMYVYFNELNLIKASLYSFNLQQKLIDKYYALGDYKYLTLDGESIKVDITTKETVPGDKKSKIPVVFISRMKLVKSLR